jgi:5-methylcytosine-specific restriction protein A
VTGRSVPEWRGKTPDSKVPPHVRARVFLAHKGVCHISMRAIRPGEPWEMEHITPLSMGGEHRERNLAPALVEPHREKTAAEATVRAKADRVRLKHIGAFPKSKTRIRGRGFAPTRGTP